LIDSAKTRVVQYRYDAWGKPLSKTGSMANTLGTLFEAKKEKAR